MICICAYNRIGLNNFFHSAANKHRSVGSTNLNRASSRSHAILTIEVTLLDPIADTSTQFLSHWGITDSLPSVDRQDKSC